MSFPRYDVFLFLKIEFILANSADPDEMQHCCISSRSSLFVKVPVQLPSKFCTKHTVRKIECYACDMKQSAKRIFVQFVVCIDLYCVDQVVACEKAYKLMFVFCLH